MDKLAIVFGICIVVGLAAAAYIFTQPSASSSQQNPNLQAQQSQNSQPAAQNLQNNQGGKMADIVILETSKGTIEVELNKAKSPITVKNYLEYVNSGFYDGTVFHRVIDGFMIQGGGFTVNGSEKPARAPIKLEASNGLKNLRGTLAMARTSDPNSATAQFFVNLVDNDFLDASPANDGYAVFGKVLKGMEVVDSIAKTRTSTRGQYDDWPVENVVITKAYVKK